MSDTAARFIGSIPEIYDSGLGPNIFAGHAADLAQRVAAARPGAVLELAAGTGIATRALRDALPAAARLTASDLNPPMLAVARRKFAPGEAVAFETADAGALPFANGAFDAVACQFGVMFFPDKPAAFREAHRVLRPGGHFIFNVWGRMEDNLFAATAQAALERAYPGNPPGFYRVPFGYNDAPAIRAALAAAGFRAPAFHSVALTREVADIAAFARALVFGNPLIEEINARGTASPDDLAAAIATDLTAALGPSRRMSVEALVVEAAR